MKKWLLIVVLVIGVFADANAQFDVHFTHYWEMQNFYNPAAAGSSRKLNFYASYSNQLTGFENSPKSMLLNVDSPIPFIKGDHNLGLGVINDAIGLFTNQHLYLNYAFGFKLFKGRMVAGAQLGLVNSSFDNSKIILGGDSNDPAFPAGKADGNTFDIGAGLFYQHKYFHVGVSGLHLNAPLILLGERNEIQIDPFFNFMAGGNIPIKNTLISVQPSLQVMTDFVSWRTDITVRGTYRYNEKNFFGGVTYSPSTSVAIFLGAEILNITLGYGYEIYTSGIGMKNGSHDIFLGYKMDLEMFNKEKNKHNSIRVLQ